MLVMCMEEKLETIRFVQLKGEFEIKEENSYLHHRWLFRGAVALIAECLCEELSSNVWWVP